MKKRLLASLLAAVLLLFACPAASADSASYPDELVEFIMLCEGFSAEAYTDGSNWYIGYGTTISEGEYPDGISENEAEALLRLGIETSASYVESFLDTYSCSLDDNQTAALISMTYSLGASWLNEESRLPSYIINGIENYSDVEIVNAFAAWCHIGGKISPALLKRRLSEANLFLCGSYSLDSGDWCCLMLDAGEGELESDVAVYKKGQPYGVLPSTELTGRSFVGWQTSDGILLSVDDVADADLSVTAVWKYSDVPESAWFYEYVSDLSSQGTISGFPDGSFRPSDSVTWAQVLKLVILAAGYGEKEPEENTHWASGYLDFAEEKEFLSAGLVTDLDAVVTRNEIADLACAALELDSTLSETPFYDSSRSSVLALYEAGIVQGSFENGNRLFKGDDNISRAELSAIIWRIANWMDENILFFYNYRVRINHDLAPNPYDSELFRTEDRRVYYEDPNYDVQYGIDVSYYQGNIDWEAVAADGIDFAIIRVGYRGCSEGELFTDVRFEEYIEGASAAGLDIGLYFFSQAVNPEEAVEEAEYLLSLIGDYEITYPIAFDWEPLSYSYSRTASYDYSVLTSCALAFCDTIDEAGYLPSVYLNESFSYLRYDIAELMDSLDIIWLAHYTEKTDYIYDFQIWQYGSSGRVDGIDGRVDMDISFVNFGS